jgi:hypothetical protein
MRRTQENRKKTILETARQREYAVARINAETFRTARIRVRNGTLLLLLARAALHSAFR